MAQWVRLCGVAEAPTSGKVIEAAVEGVDVCLANVNGELAAMDNWCPHRRGPLGQGWVEGEAVICPWHAWAFNTKTGKADYPEHERVDVFPVKIEGRGRADRSCVTVGAGMNQARHAARSEDNFLLRRMALAVSCIQPQEAWHDQALNTRRTTMKLRNAILAIVALVILAGSAVPAEAMARHHRHHHRHHRG